MARVSSHLELARSRKAWAEDLEESNRLESVGRLAGGIAHDFNNLLTGVLGNASLAQNLISSRHAAQPLLEGVIDSAEQAAHLTHQMLAFARKGAFVIESVELSQAVSESLRSARDQVPDHIGLEQDLARGLVVKADSSQLRQLVSNLLRNAIEAIGERSGTIRIRTWMHDVAAEGCAVEFPGKRLPRGRYASLEVTDTGGGMDRARRAKIFEPFFTTKFLGRGLGRAAVAGIVAAHKGGIQVESDPAGRAALFACTCRSRNPLDRSHVTPW